MRTVNAEFHERPGKGEVWVIALTLPWCVIRIELPNRHFDTRAPSSRSRFNARRRSPATTESSPRAAARTKGRTERRSAANGWRDIS
ncbi:MAG: hypothetical protein ACK5KM_01735 [Hyphomicrobiaceae bacterium]